MLVKMELDEKGRLTPTQIGKIRNEHSAEKARIDLLYSYYNADNLQLKHKPIKPVGVPDNKNPFAYGYLIPSTTIGYMLKNEITFKAVDDDELKVKADYVIEAAGGMELIKEILEDVILYGVGYTVVVQTNKGKTDNTPTYKFAKLEARECVPVYSYDIIPELIAVVRFYTIGNVQHTDVFYADAIETIKGGKSKTIEKIEHKLGRVPVSVCRVGDTPKGVAERVIKLIDALDKLSNEDLNEIDKFAMAIRVAYNIKIDTATMKDADSGAILEMSGNGLGSDPRLEYLTREINDNFHGNLREFLINQIHKLSTVPDFDSKDFAAESGIALRYKLLGFENTAGNIEKYMKRSIIDIVDMLFTYNGINEDTRTLKVNMTRNLPQDLINKLTVAKSMKEVGLSMDAILTYLDELIGDIEKEKKRQEDERNKLFDEALTVDLVEDVNTGGENGDNSNNGE